MRKCSECLVLPRLRISFASSRSVIGLKSGFISAISQEKGTASAVSKSPFFVAAPVKRLFRSEQCRLSSRSFRESAQLRSTNGLIGAGLCRES